MKRIYQAFFVLLFTVVALSGCSDSKTPQEGDQYSVIPTPMPAMKGVTEIFSLSCGHCRKMESILPEIKKLTNSDIKQVHVIFNESAQKAAFIFYAAMVQTDNKPSHALVEQLFAFVQDSPKDMSVEQRKTAIDKIFHDNNLKSPYELTEAQQKEVFKMFQQSEDIVRNAALESVPAFLVNGKYLVNTSAHKSLQDLANTIVYLKNKQ
ncbi:thiol:disulfide interchange protein DsbA/DsbL [Photobacterium aquimaris]|uniref:Thiol:disulfide interchange protein DsbA n=1 Tax=Photobacterium aquimaris TaxID=512643 RepID=A0A1B8I5D0_9GAMM|nr:thiol:disulfide interchange protein DsbA/DsbL [Photobacterium aquimaris]MCP4956829.1 thiol:disulfide interchange protein DsbA/DsbL [Photobacterium aquimaris]OBU26358.1 peptide permease [Photobacterium aquimaris]PQJ40893.1 peptide permease [Photobacterium aquimaris]PSU12257.1 thiol:disulfide interchange protein DsbA/DsbL [Photobacterium aquimaris]SMY15319.1 Thiol:disulfide interchange protein DsbA precursor [Photobacterium aquimaris]